MIWAPAVANRYACTGRNFSGSGFGTTSRLRLSPAMHMAPASSQSHFAASSPMPGWSVM